MIQIFFLLASVFAFAEPASKIHLAQCGLEKDCRVNVITSRRHLEAQCTGKLFGELNCEMKLMADTSEANLTLLCKDSKLVTHLDATVPVDFYSYRVMRILKKNGVEKLRLDPKSFYSFSHPAFRATLAHGGEELTGEIHLVLNKIEHKMEQVECSNFESGPSSDARVQNESQS